MQSEKITKICQIPGSLKTLIVFCKLCHHFTSFNRPSPKLPFDSNVKALCKFDTQCQLPSLNKPNILVNTIGRFDFENAQVQRKNPQNFWFCLILINLKTESDEF